jgi:hypothetical protein
MNHKIGLGNFDILLQVQQGKLEFRKLFLRHGDAHFAIARISTSAPSTYKCVEPWFNAVGDHCMETLVGRLIATE